MEKRIQWVRRREGILTGKERCVDLREVELGLREKTIHERQALVNEQSTEKKRSSSFEGNELLVTS